MSTSRHGKYGFIDKNNPEAMGVCDRGGEVRKHKDLHKEMIYAGRSLVWNGMLCCDDHIDKPHPQSRLLVLTPDPVPIKLPRPIVPMVPRGGYLQDDNRTLDSAGDFITDSSDGSAFSTTPFPE